VTGRSGLTEPTSRLLLSGYEITHAVISQLM
jgi:hypothetical protein